MSAPVLILVLVALGWLYLAEVSDDETDEAVNPPYDPVVAAQLEALEAAQKLAAAAWVAEGQLYAEACRHRPFPAGGEFER